METVASTRGYSWLLIATAWTARLLTMSSARSYRCVWGERGMVGGGGKGGREEEIASCTNQIVACFLLSMATISKHVCRMTQLTSGCNFSFLPRVCWRLAKNSSSTTRRRWRWALSSPSPNPALLQPRPPCPYS